MSYLANQQTKKVKYQMNIGIGLLHKKTDSSVFHKSEEYTLTPKRQIFGIVE